MPGSLAERIHKEISDVFRSRPGAWMVWCDPAGAWLPLLRHVAESRQPGGFMLVEIADVTADQLGGPLARRQLQVRIEAGQPFVLHLPRPADQLGWLWAQAALAERVYTRSLREQLRDWGWRPQSLTIADEELAELARRNLGADPAEWGGGGLQPDIPLLLDVLASGAAPGAGDRLVLDLTTDQAGLPRLTPDDLPRWRTLCLAKLLATQAHVAAPDLVSERHELVIQPPQQEFALALLDRWLDSLRLSKRLADAILDADRSAGLGALMAAADATQGPFLSYAAERAVFASTCAQLARAGGRDLLETLAALGDAFARHAGYFWGDGLRHPQAIPWGELRRLSQAAQVIQEASPAREWAKPAEAIRWYTERGWQLDRAGEEILRDLERRDAELIALISPLRAAFRARWEDSLLRWSSVWIAAGCPLPEIGTAGAWLKNLLSAPRATAILILDALRYDLGATLVSQINELEGAGRASVTPARAPFPTITPLGMGLALPIPESEFDADLVEGKWRLCRAGRDENLATAAGRRTAWLAVAGIPRENFQALNDLLARPVPAPAAGHSRLAVYDSAIDTLGHDDELETQGSSSVLERYLKVIARLREAGWLRILIVTDHGYIHWAGSTETSVTPPLPNPGYLSRRAAAYPSHQATAEGSPLPPGGWAPGGRWRIAMPSGAACYRAYGGLGFFHGGASLQEWIIPCIAVEWPSQARPVDVTLEALPQVLSQRQRVTLRVQRSGLLLEDAIPRQVDIVIRETRARTILFRSERVTVTPDRDEVIVLVDAVEGAAAERGTAVRVEVRDVRTDDDVLASCESILAISLTGW
jgi:hypothetical protein